MASLGACCALRNHAWRVLPTLGPPLAFMASLGGAGASLLESLDAPPAGSYREDVSNGFFAGMGNGIGVLPDLSLLDHDGDLGRLGSPLLGGGPLSIALGTLFGIGAETSW